MSGAEFERERYEEAEREAEEKEDEAPELSESERQERDRKREAARQRDLLDVLPPLRTSWGYRLGRGSNYNSIVAVVGLILLFFLVNFGLTVAVFAILFLIADVACIGKVSDAVNYSKKARHYGFNDPQGTRIAWRLGFAQICFTLILLAFAFEEILRFALNIGISASAEWLLWISWFVGIILVGVIFLSLIIKWGLYQYSKKFKETYQKIMGRERLKRRR